MSRQGLRVKPQITMETPLAKSELKFDPIVVDVELAKKYLLDHKQDIEQETLPDINELEKVPKSKRKCMLIQKIKENTKLLCQLEYLENNIPIEISEINLQLLIKFFSLEDKYTSKYLYGRSDYYTYTILLALFDHIILGDDKNKPAIKKRTAAHLLKSICLESGLDCFYDSMAPIGEREVNIGVISESSDLESAVDAFLASPSHPCCVWRLHRIYVQESVYETFKEVLDIKTTLKGRKAAECVELKPLCSDLFVYDEKYVLIDYAGDHRVVHPQLEGKHTIFVEAYRTNKELLSLLDQRVLFASVWSSDVAEANELAYSIPAALVWINDYGNFDGPPEISTFINATFSYDEIKLPYEFDSKCKIWRSFSNDKRLDIMREVISELGSGDATQDTVNLLDTIAKIKINSVVVSNNKMCVTLDCAFGIYEPCDYDISNIILSLVVGNGVVFLAIDFPFNDELWRAGVPLLTGNYYRNKLISKSDDVLLPCYSFPRTKVVLTNFGTIFAN